MKEPFIDISINDFNNFEIPEKHIFSDRYEKEKRRMISSISTRRAASPSFKLVAAAIILVILIPAGVYAAGKYFGFFNGAWGGAGRKSHEEYTTPADNPDDKPIKHPAVEYTDVDEDLADKTVGEVIEELPFSVDLNGTQLTLTSIVKDKLGNAVIEYTLERKGGILPEQGDTGKGLLNATSDYSFSIGFGFAHTSEGYAFKDEERSTDEKWYCYDYILKDDTSYYSHIDHMKQYLNSWLDCSYDEVRDYYAEFGIEFGEDQYEEFLNNITADLEIYNNPPDKDALVISYTIIKKEMEEGKYYLRSESDEYCEEHTVTFQLSDKALDTRSFISQGEMESIIEISPISVKISGIEDGSHDIIIYFNDGTEYIVENDKYDNTYNGRYMYDGDGDGIQDINTLLLMFNRLVDVEKIDHIIIDEEIYK